MEQSPQQETGVPVSAPPRQPDGNRFIPLTQWQSIHKYPTTGGLRHLVFFKEKFGFDACIRRVGRKVLISEKDFFEWLARDGGNVEKRNGGR